MPHCARLDRRGTCVLLIGPQARARRLPYLKQKLVLVWSAMRHFADDAACRGLDDRVPRVADLPGGPRRDAARRVAPPAASWNRRGRAPRSTRGDGTRAAAGVARRRVVRTTCSSATRRRSRAGRRAEDAAAGKNFYRDMRRRTGLLMDGGEARRRTMELRRRQSRGAAAGARSFHRSAFAPDAGPGASCASSSAGSPASFGGLDGFAWPVTRADAERFHDDFLDHRLDLFGPYEDAIVRGRARSTTRCCRQC